MIKRINLIPEELRYVEREQFYLLASGLLLIYTALLYFIYYEQRTDMKEIGSDVLTRKQEVAGLKVQSDKAGEVVGMIQNIESNMKEETAKVDIVTALVREKTSWADILYDLSNIIPSGTWISSFSSFNTIPVRGKELKVNGMALSSALITDFMDAIERSQYFKGVALVYAHSAKYGRRQAFSYELTFRLEESG